MNPRKIILSKPFNWFIATLLFFLSLLISVQPPFFDIGAPFQYLHLMALMIILMLTAGEFPLWILLLVGIIVDTFHQNILGSSSLLFLFFLPLVQLFCQSTVRFSLLQIWGVFCMFLCCYILGQLLINTVLSKEEISLLTLLVNSIFGMVLFPILFAGVLFFFQLRKNGALTPL